MILVSFTVPFYHFLFLRYLVLAERLFSSYILVPFPDSTNLYSRGMFFTLNFLQKNTKIKTVKFRIHTLLIFSANFHLCCYQTIKCIFGRSFFLDSHKYNITFRHKTPELVENQCKFRETNQFDLSIKYKSF